MRLGLILTNDWELFEDGFGNFFEIQYNPTIELIDLLNKYDAKMTFFAEVCQQFGHLGFSDKFKNLKDISKKWEDAMKLAVKSGNDVQLHLHPQWICPNYDGSKWTLNMDNWAIATMADNPMLDLIRESKKYLEDLLKPVNPAYQCHSFRAGAYGIQPEERVIRNLKKAGIKCDTSVTKNYINPGFYDFSKAPSNLLPWNTKAESLQEIGDGKSGLLEFPIYSLTINASPATKKYMPKIFYKAFWNSEIPADELSWEKEREKVKNKRYPRNIRFYKKNQKKNFRFYLNALASKNTYQLDYDNMPATLFVDIVERVYNNKSLDKLRERDLIIPIVASGHIKDSHNLNNIKKILDQSKSRLKDDLVFLTIDDAYKCWREIAAKR